MLLLKDENGQRGLLTTCVQYSGWLYMLLACSYNYSTNIFVCLQMLWSVVFCITCTWCLWQLSNRWVEMYTFLICSCTVLHKNIFFIAAEASVHSLPLNRHNSFQVLLFFWDLLTITNIFFKAHFSQTWSSSYTVFILSINWNLNLFFL